jgi:O-6-methylguanine DNA methyltransferase
MMHTPSQRVVAVKLLQNQWFGTLRVEAEPGGVCAISWADDATVSQAVQGVDDTPADDASAEHWAHIAVQQLEEYFAGQRKQFEVPLVLRGTPFQVSVWKALLQIPYGETRSYGDIARAIGRDRAVRAVGQANRANPIPVIIPCHRVVGSNGTLTGYAGDQVHLKRHLLEHEHAVLPVKSPRQPRMVEPKTVILPLV